MIKIVVISSRAKKDLGRVPGYIADKLLAWVKRVESVGVEDVRLLKGYHDEPLHGPRKGQRSIRLSRSYRAIYLIKEGGSVEFISVEEVNKHAY